MQSHYRPARPMAGFHIFFVLAFIVVVYIAPPNRLRLQLLSLFAVFPLSLLAGYDDDDNRIQLRCSDSDLGWADLDPLTFRVNAVKFYEHSTVVVSAGYDRSVRVWDCRSHSTEPVQIIDTFLDSVMFVCVTKTEMVAGSVDGIVRTFDIRIGREISEDLGQPVNCISHSNDGDCAFATCLDSTLRLLDRSTGELLQEYKGHTYKSCKMNCCLTNTDGHVAGGSQDGFFYFWDLVDASVVSRFRAHSSVANF